MYFADYHTHSLCSPDSRAPLADQVAAARKAGLNELCITDHYDLLTPMGERKSAYDWAPALKQFRSVRQALEGEDFTLRLGLELGSAAVDPKLAAQVLEAGQPDFVIGSLHNYTLSGGGGDYFYVQYTSPEVCYAVLDDYFTGMEALAPLSECYDVLGHIIYPLRYMLRDGQKDISLARYYERIRSILRTAVEHGRGIEINTWCGRTVAEWRPILALYREVGGEIVTTGSDAHRTDCVGRGIPESCALLKEMGFPYLAVYEARAPRFIKL